MPARSKTLLVDGCPVAPVEVAATFAARTRGLLGRDHLDGALLVRPANSIHTCGMRFPIDVALCTAGLEVIAVRRIVPWRVTRPRRGVRVVVEAEAGRLAAWGVRPGSALAISD